MRILLLPISLAVTLLLLPKVQAATAFDGRWDLTITADNGNYPDWLEVTDAGGATKVRVQLRTGSVRPATDVSVENDKLTLTAFKGDGETPVITWRLQVQDGQLTGTEQRGGSSYATIKGVRAPELDRKAPQSWPAPISLFNGKDLNDWEPDDVANSHWVAQDGVIRNTEKGANLRTKRKFQDFKLHIEYNCPQGGNSGIYLRGRYEVQVEYEPDSKNDRFHRMGSIYGMIAPSRELPKKPGTWESFDITLVGRTVTVIRDGVTIIDHQQIAGITGGALDSNEANPGPLYIQGDHTGGLEFRNITISAVQ